jgi:hypothetical protein
MYWPLLEMRSIFSLSPYVIFLALIGLAAFFVDSLFPSLRNFLPISRPEDISTVYRISSIGCVIAVIGILYFLRKTEDNMKGSKSTYVLKNIVFASQSVIIVIIIITLFQLHRDGTFNLANVIILFSLSYGVGLYCMVLLVLKFLGWFRFGREVIVLGYALTMCVFIVFLITSIMYAWYELSTNIYPNVTSSNIGLQVVSSNPLPSVYGSYFYYAYLLTFISIYLITLLSLRIHLKKIRPAFFYLVFSTPLVYFLLKVLPFFTAFIAGLIAYSPTFYGTLYSLTFSGTGPLGGILFSMVLLAFSRRMDNLLVRNYLSISALGMLLFFIANQNPPLQESLLPPFGLISKSFVGLSCYMIFIGIYFTVTHLSRRNTLTNVVLKELSMDRLFSSAVRSEHEMQVRGVIDKNIDHIEVFKESEPKELSKDEVAELVRLVKKEISGPKEPESS